jgi:DNA-directed RNA polymerase subunit M/transcription elongation factor TFIIS
MNTVPLPESDAFNELKGAKCPQCGGYHTYYGKLVGIEYVTRECECMKCAHKWRIVYVPVATVDIT